MSLDPNKTYLTWNGSEFPNYSEARFKAPAGSSIDWGDGTVETFETASETVNTHTYTDGKDTHTIAISGLTKIVNGAFWNCRSLTNITIGNGVTNIGYNAFENCRSLTNITIGNGVTSISGSAFYYCSSLTSIEIPDSVTSIGNRAFSDCSSLTSITIPDSVTSIGSGAFEDCSSLTSVIIPNSVTSIYSSAFNGCSNLKTIILFPETPPTLGSNAIPTTISKIYVQKSSKALYKAATNWTTFANKIVSNNIYLSFIRFNQKNKKYIDEKFDYLNDNTGALLDFSIDNTTFVLTATLKNANGEILGTPQTIDLPIESLVVNGNYDNDSKTLILTLQNGNTVDIPVSGLIDGLATLADLKNYVKFTDYANENKAGAVKINNAFGIRIDTNGALYLDTANDNEISNQQGYTAIKTNQIPKAVKSGLVKHDDITLTDEEKTSACDWIGAIKKDTSISTTPTPNKIPKYNQFGQLIVNCTEAPPDSNGGPYTQYTGEAVPRTLWRAYVDNFHSKISANKANINTLASKLSKLSSNKIVFNYYDSTGKAVLKKNCLYLVIDHSGSNDAHMYITDSSGVDRVATTQGDSAVESLPSFRLALIITTEDFHHTMVIGQTGNFSFTNFSPLYTKQVIWDNLNREMFIKTNGIGMSVWEIQV